MIRRSITLLSILAFAALTLTAPAQAGVAHLLADLNSHPVSPGDGLRPFDLTSLGSRAVFVGREPTTGYEMWTTDGTSLGTHLLRDACPGNDGRPTILLAHGGLAFFLEPCARHLWRTDGTSEGTFDLGLDLGLKATVWAVLGDQVLFTACPDGEMCALWTTDGSASGTKALVELGPSYLQAPHQLVATTDAAYFVASTLEEGQKLWRSDGTTGGTAVIAAGLGELRRLSPDGEHLFFIGANQLWVTAGTPASTRQLTTFAATSALDQTRFIRRLGGAVYFVADDVTHGSELWRTDGTPEGTLQATDFPYAYPFTYLSLQTDQLQAVGDRILFPATDGLHPVGLWSTTGTPQSTRRLTDCPGGCPTMEYPTLADERFVTDGNLLYFRGADDARGIELWRTDGTDAGTYPVIELCAGTCWNGLESLTAIGDGVYFVAWQEQQRRGLWRTDGTAAGTRLMIQDVEVGESTERDPPIDHALLGDGFVFAAMSTAGEQLWRSDGTAAGSCLLTLVGDSGSGSSNPSRPIQLTGGLAFTARDASGIRTWRTSAAEVEIISGPSAAPHADTVEPIGQLGEAMLYFKRGFDSRPQIWRAVESADETLELTQFRYPSRLGGPVRFGEGFAFAVEEDPEGGAAIWITDGTLAGTHPLIHLPDQAIVRHLTAIGNALYFVAGEPGATGLWHTDGTVAGTTQLLPRLGSGAHPDAPLFTTVGDLVFFLRENDYDNPLWRTDGTPAGTIAVPGPHSVSRMTALGSFLVYFGQGPDLQFAFWRLDPATNTPTQLAQIDRPYPSDESEEFVGASLGDQLIFAASESAHGEELWVTDGTAAGTRLLSDIEPGARASKPSNLMTAAGAVYFAARTSTHGRELWTSDGTAAGTRRIHDIAPGPRSSDPHHLAFDGEKLFFAANDGLVGVEPWILKLAPDTPACSPDESTLCLRGGRFRVEARWHDFQDRTGAGHAVQLTPDTGTFWFFTPDNLEVIVKALDGRPVNEHHWVFYGALSNVEYSITVTDTTTGATRRYVNPPRQLASVGDTRAFGPLGAWIAVPVTASSTPIGSSAFAKTAECIQTSSKLCLQEGRFAVDVSWEVPSLGTGTGNTVPLTSDTGAFWFFAPGNLELLVKVLDGRPINGKFWVFYGALSNVAYTLTVTDTQSGHQRVYHNPHGRMASVADTGAF